MQIAIRSGTRDEFKELQSSGRLISVQDIPNRMSELRGRPIYLTVDLDWFDPAVMPGTGTPEPGGFVWNDFAAVINELRHHRLMGADVVELAPQLDPSGISSVLGRQSHPQPAAVDGLVGHVSKAQESRRT